VIAAALILAHAGHWLAGLLYLAPVVIIVGALGYQSWKDRREGDDDAEGAEPDIDVRKPDAAG
jgi:4-hydroxybenzoate polyprenyltransferase